MKNSTLCYIDDGKSYLMLHRTKKDEDPNKGKWIGVGGKFEDKESPDDCLVREVCEETGLTLTDYRLRGIVTFVSDIWETEYMYLYTASGYEGSLCDCNEGELAWIAKDRISGLTLWEGDRLFLDLIASDHPFFSLKLCYNGDHLVEAVLGREKLKLK